MMLNITIWKKKKKKKIGITDENFHLLMTILGYH